MLEQCGPGILENFTKNLKTKRKNGLTCQKNANFVTFLANYVEFPHELGKLKKNDFPQGLYSRAFLTPTAGLARFQLFTF